MAVSRGVKQRLHGNNLGRRPSDGRRVMTAKGQCASATVRPNDLQGAATAGWTDRLTDERGQAQPARRG
ncbi:hypothetical protein E5Q_04687 [Mixia osmundae IAM 14324]|uniref:Uncharacterized protein n=1 Tax=Mixia osmundae (strain CBS 9802 / IAM 14324 / JCM 22182 / KY 12970) TaxID=764103 RepID=G7E597_MIXOS|nr:hypothetical protein E5Q_04687 [Mixia osmundae IAM 14324]